MKIKNDKECIIKYCGKEHCDNTNRHNKVCGNCYYYKPIDSGFGNCMGLPPERVYKLSWFRLKSSYEIRIVGWCQKPCGLFRRWKK